MGKPFSFEKESIRILRESLQKLEKGFHRLPKQNIRKADTKAASKVLRQVAQRLQDNYPYFHPLYAGQMLKPPHQIARLAYALAMWINPNNHALDGGRASSAMEKEAVAEIANMFGWKSHLGHLTSGGTMANLEALWIAGQLNPGKTIVASEQAHYTHSRISSVLGLKFDSIRCNDKGQMDVDALRVRLERGDVGAVVATIGTTATGSVDPLPQMLALRERHRFLLHADAAYGGYFCLADNLEMETRASYERLHEVDSIVVDPHKHGLQPYGCGCIIFKDPSVGRFYKHDSPYTYFSSGDLHLGEISLECSRPGAAAVGLWATQKLFPLVRRGKFAKMLEDCRRAALALHRKISSDARFIPAFSPELDIVVWVPAALSVSEASELSRKIFHEAAKKNLHLALAELPVDFFSIPEGMKRDQERVTCFRSVLMKPEHFEWIDRIWSIFDVAAKGVPAK